MRPDEARRGMTGYGLTVFQGTKIERFNVEVLGTLQKVMGGGDLVMIRVTSGPVVQRQSGIIEGMSGSPVYINGKMLGAVAIGFGFPKEPIGGVTPITEMIETALPGPGGVAAGAGGAAVAGQNPGQTPGQVAPHAVAASGKALGQAPSIVLTAGPVRDMEYVPRDPLMVDGHAIDRVVVSTDPGRLPLSGSVMTMRPCTRLLQLSGVDAASLPRWTKLFAPFGYTPVLGGGTMSGSKFSQVFGIPSSQMPVATPFVPGAGIGVQLVSGDLDMTGVGTVTFRWGNRIVAFGHPMFGLGACSMPMTTAYIEDIFPAYDASFKLASPMATVGELEEDTNFAIGGTLGAHADTIPMTVVIRDPEQQIDKAFHVHLIKDPDFTPQLAIGVASQALSAVLGLESDKMVRLGLRVELANGPTIVRDNYVYSSDQVAGGAGSDLLDALMLTQLNGFEKGAIKRLDLSVDVRPGRDTARIVRIFTDRNKVRAGDTVNVTVVLEPLGPRAEAPVNRSFAFTVPADAPDGLLRLVASPGDDFWLARARVGGAPPRADNLTELVNEYQRIGPSNELVVQSSTARNFWLIDHRKVDNPPATWLRLVPPGPADGIGRYNEVDDSRDLTHFALSGLATATIPVESQRHSDRFKPDTAEAAGAANTPPGPPDMGMQVPGAPGADGAAGGGDGGGPDAGADAGGGDGQDGGPGDNPGADGNGGDTGGDNGGDNGDGGDDGNETGAITTSGRLWGGEVSPSQFPSLAAREARLRTLLMGAGGPLSTVKPVIMPSAAGSITAITPVTVPTPTPTPTPAPAADASAVKIARPVGHWTQKDAGAFLKGTFDGTEVAQDGTVRPGPHNRLLASTGEPVAWSVAATATAEYLGTGNSARIYKVQGGNVTNLYEAAVDGPEVAVTALAADSQGNLYAGLSPAGRVLRFNGGDGKPDLIFQTGDTFVNALEFDAKGRLLVATGGVHGALYRIDQPATARANGAVPQPLATVPQAHILSISVGSDAIYAGTGNEGVLYKIDGESGATKALYQTATPAPNPFQSQFLQNAEAAMSAMSQGGGAQVLGGSGNAAYLLMAGEIRPGSEGGMPSLSTPGNGVIGLVARPEGIYFTTLTSGSVWRWSEQHGIEEIFKSTGHAVYALKALADGSLLAGCDGAEIWHIVPGIGNEETVAARWIDTTQRQVVAICVTPGGEVFAGTGNNAALYEIGPGAGTGPGTFVSNTFDARQLVRWGALRALAPQGDFSGQIETRSGNTLEPDVNWSPWQAVQASVTGIPVASPPARYLQYRVTFAPSAPEARLAMVDVSFRAPNRAPNVGFTFPSGGESLAGKKSITWMGVDPDHDPLRYTLKISSDQGATWTPIELKDPSAATYSLDTTKYKDGEYILHVVGSDAARNPDDPASDYDTTLPFLIDNTPPVLGTPAVTAADGGWNISVTATDALSDLAGAEWRVVPDAAAKTTDADTGGHKAAAGDAKPSDGKDAIAPDDSTKDGTAADADVPMKPAVAKPDWQAASTSDGIFDSKTETIVARVDPALFLSKGPAPKSGAKLEIRVRDAAGNPATVIVTLP